MVNAILLISCCDQRGITAAVSNFIAVHQGNIEHADQHIDHQKEIFLMRIEWALKDFSVPKEKIPQEFLSIAKRFAMSWDIYFTDDIPRVAIFVSKPLHCLYDLLLRQKYTQICCEIPLIVSNHPDARDVAQNFNIPFHEFFIDKENKCDQEQKQMELLRKAKIDLVVLARYQQILTPQFVAEFKNRIINIHHSFLPAFVGANPYAQAYQKGVKIIGTTSHYVSEKLDEGPIIEQDTVRVSHRDSLQDLILKGEDLERMVLSRALRWHLARKILCYGNKTVIFD